MPSPYWQSFRPLRGIYLEGSAVLGVRASAHELLFDLEMLLTPSHPSYRGPGLAGGQDLQRGRLLIHGDRVEYQPRQPEALRPATAAAGGWSFIDSWDVSDDHWSTLHGDWGTARVLAATVRVDLVGVDDSDHDDAEG